MYEVRATRFRIRTTLEFSSSISDSSVLYTSRVGSCGVRSMGLAPLPLRDASLEIPFQNAVKYRL
jgi:hypothetical protein